MITRISLVPDRSIAPKQDTSGCQLFFGVETSATSLCSKPVLRVPEHVQIPECFAKILPSATPVKESSSIIRERQWAEREPDGARDPGKLKRPQKNLFREPLEAKEILSAVRCNRKRITEMERLRKSLTFDDVPLSEVAAIVNKRLLETERKRSSKQIPARLQFTSACDQFECLDPAQDVVETTPLTWYRLGVRAAVSSLGNTPAKFVRY